MDEQIIFFFAKMPQALPLYQAFARQMQARFEGYTVKVQKTQISFSNKYNFAFVSLPYRKIKGRPDVYIIVSFGLSHKVDDPRISVSVEPYPNRWTHHVIVQNADEIDAQLMAWIAEAYSFSMFK